VTWDRAALPALPSEFRGAVTLDPESLGRYGRDESPEVGQPSAAVLPEDVRDLTILIRWARAHRVPLIARGGGTSLDGESVPVLGGVVVDLSGWNWIGDVDPVERTVRVGPGVVNRDLHERLRPSGLFFPPNPGSWASSTIGGNVATNASGPRSLRYGATRRWVRRLDGVLGTGEPATFGGSVSKRSIGPDLLGLMVGSEGTLGIFSEVTLALAAAPARRTVLVLPLPPTPSVGTIAQSLVADPALGLSALEYLDRGSADALAHEEGSRLPSGSPLLLAESESGDAEEEPRRLQRWMDRLRALGLRDDPIVYPDADRLWTLRGSSGTVLNRTFGPRVREDVAVPLHRIDELFEGVDGLARRYSVDVYVYGHLGEGNLHPNYVIDPSTERARALRRELLELARRLGGTISAEHGVGSVKREHLGLELGPSEISLLRAIKSFCDPDGILNPGKLYPGASGATGATVRPP
jgi:D-lactate dehydrogenase